MDGWWKNTDSSDGLFAVKTREVTVRFNGIRVGIVENLEYDPHNIGLTLFENDGVIDSFSVLIRPHETLIFRIGIV